MRYLPWLLGGFGLLGLSRMLEAFGDSFPMAADGVSWDRLTFHGLALVVVLGGVACFLYAGRKIYRDLRGAGSSAPAQPVRLTAPAENPQAPSEFDADAALARYLARKEQQQADSPPAAPRPPTGGFGRRGL